MRQKRLFRFRMLTCVAIGVMMLGSFLWTSVKGTELEEVDLSKGVTYESIGINLNGNSVVITDSDDSTESNRLCNIYLDVNRNGQIDDGEEKISLPNVTGTEIPAVIPIYGIYKQKSDTPISITILSGYHNIVYGVYEGELNVEDSDETACRISVQDGQIAGNISAAVNSRIVTTASTAAAIAIKDSNVSVIQGVSGGEIITGDSAPNAVDINMQGVQIAGSISATVNSRIVTTASTAAAIAIKDSNINVIQAVSGGEIITGDSAQNAVDISITGDTVFQSSLCFSNDYPILQSDNIQGDVVVDINPQTTSNIDRFYCLGEGTSIDGSLSVNIDHLSIKNVLYIACTDCNITGDMSLISGNEIYSPAYFLTYSTNVTGDVTAELYGSMQNNSSATTLCYLISDDSIVGGNVDITLKDGTFSQVYGVYSATVEGNVDITLKDGTYSQVYGVQNATVKGNVDISYEAGTYSYYVWGISNSSVVEKNVTLTSGEKAAFAYDFRGCTDGTKIGGSFTADIYNANTSDANTFSGVGAADVAGEIDVKLHGGNWQYVYGIYASSKYQYNNDCRIEFENVNTSRMTGINYGSITGNAAVIMTACETQLGIQGIYNSEITGDASVTITDCNSGYDIYDIGYSTISGDTSISMKKVICSGGSSVYSARSANLGGNITVDIEEVTVGSVYGMRSTSTTEEDCDVTVSIKGCTATIVYGIYDSNLITGTIDVSIEDCIVSDTVYGLNGSNGQKNVSLKTANNQIKNFIGIYSGKIAGDVTLIADGDNIDNASDGDYSGIQYGTVEGDVAITTKDCQYGNYTGVDRATCNANTQITIDGGTYTGSSIQPYFLGATNENCEVVIVFANAAFTSDSSSATIINNISGDGILTMTIEDSCTINDAYKVYPLESGSINALLIYQNDYYFAKNYPITEDINARNIYFGTMDDKSIAANILIPEGITVTAEDNIHIPNCGSVLIEGTLNGNVFREGSNYDYGTVYMNGGKMENEEQVNIRYYPLTISYLEKGGTIATGTPFIAINSLRPEQYFGAVGYEPTVTCTAKKGYTLTEVTVTKEGGEPQVLTANEDNEYSFDMEACPAELAITFTGTQITLDKSEASLTTRLYDETTKAAPLYDLTTIEISNDGEEGEVLYEADETSGLPKGLELVDGKLFGAPVQAFEDGTDVVIQITGRNDTTTEFTLHITVMAGDEDGTPAYRVPNDLTASYGDTLGDVNLPSDENGTFTWNQEESTSVGNPGTHEFLVTYTPTNKKYQTVTDIPVTLTVQKAKVEFSKIEELNAVYKDTLADIVLPETEGGEYQWIAPLTTEVVDKTAYQLSFQPEDVDNYDWESVEGWNEEKGLVIWSVTVHVEKLNLSISKAPVSVSANCGMTLSQIELPCVKDGKWYWKEEELAAPAVPASDLPDGALEWQDKETVLAGAGETEYDVSYVPEDTEHYKTVTDIKMTVIIEHAYNESWETDDNSHWHACACGDVQEKAEHVWDDGVVIKEATATEDGVIQYTCTVCNETKSETINATGSTGNNPQDNPAQEEGPAPGENSQNPTPTDTTQDTTQGTEKNIPAAGTILTDSVTKAKYQVTSKAGEEPAVMYLSSTNASASTLSIAANVTIDGISYKVTAIADNAFKNNKKLKKITIGANIITIGNSAFYGCTALTTVKMGSGVEKIGNKAFYGCKKLTTLTLGANVTTLGNSVFYNCIALKKVTIPKKVKKIGSKAFYNCKKLVSITIKTTKLTTKNVGSKAFKKAGSSNYKKLKVKVPKNKLKAYKKMLKKKGLSPKAKVKKS